jgi:phospholipid transport system substrate-binding protein
VKKKFFIIICFILAFTKSSFAYDSNPEVFISEIVDEAKKILVESNSKEFKTKKLSEMAIKTVDIKMIANYSLGSYRKTINEDQLKTYFNLFEKYFLKSFTSRLTDYSEPKITVLSSKEINPKFTIVNSLLLADDKKPEVKIDWRVSTKNPEQPLIVDLIVEGLSLARATKEEFASVIESNNGDVTKLFDTLKEFASK